MVLYNFKSIQVVPTSKDFLDIILSKTQRKTPTVIHKGYAIARIRQFYMRKVKFTSQSFHDKLFEIIEQFPKLDEIHPFYADLMNVLYDRDHYKLALGHANTAMHLVDTLGKDYVKLLKYGDSLYRCKQLKRAALGRMCTVVKGMKSSLEYLEQVRQHLARLPTIDPNTRTILVCGYPNVGKSSFINIISRANVEVQPYAFTTKSLYVGHFDYNYLRWQCIDTPGILDHPLEERNTIEMQSITALAHLRASVLYIIDISERCGFTIKEQCALFNSIRPLFANKPLLVVVNKIDVRRFEDVPDEDRELIMEIAKLENVQLLHMSNVSEEGVMNVRNNACEKLLTARVDQKLRGKKVNDVLNRLHLAEPKPRDGKVREVTIPASVLKARMMSTEEEAEEADAPRKLEKDLMWEEGGPGIYIADLRKKYLLKNPEWNYDIMPEILDGKNIADFLDPEIEAKLEELEREEEQRLKELETELTDEEDIEDLDSDEEELLREIKHKKFILKSEHQWKKSGTTHISRSRVERKTQGQLESQLSSMGVPDSSRIAENIAKANPRRSRSKSAEPSKAAAMDSEGGAGSERQGRKRSRSRSTAPEGERSLTPGFRSVKHKAEAVKIGIRQQKTRNRLAKAGEADRVILTKMPKHLFSGKRKMGTTSHR
eukprot:TRINITY_DN2028_c0_g1_i1.p1 TRINITY_DN2028_c0_g1~~TRINITY_DN2028_c0_g1_i1.p1  ORF type:complete len:658 (-),score=165.54 TRINITY_DN2028_c0_g1_i1:335-2308(-)